MNIRDEMKIMQKLYDKYGKIGYEDGKKFCDKEPPTWLLNDIFFAIKFGSGKSSEDFLMDYEDYILRNNFINHALEKAYEDIYDAFGFESDNPNDNLNAVDYVLELIDVYVGGFFDAVRETLEKYGYDVCEIIEKIYKGEITDDDEIENFKKEG